MAWRYKFDDGPEKPLEIKSTLYCVAAMAALSREDINLLPDHPAEFGIHPYKGHKLELWDDELLPDYGPYFYGLGMIKGHLSIITLSKRTT